MEYTWSWNTGPPIGVKNLVIRPPLENYCECTRLLVKAGADINHANINGWSVLNSYSASDNVRTIPPTEFKRNKILLSNFNVYMLMYRELPYDIWRELKGFLY